MSTITMSFDAKNDKGNNRGDYEMFVDVHSGDVIQLLPPTGYAVKGAKMYQGTESGGVGTGGPFGSNPQKQTDKNTLGRGNATTATYTDVFVTNGSMDEFVYADAAGSTPATLTNSSAPDTNLGGFEFLIWLVSTTDSNDNDYADPGIRNRG